MGKGVPGHAACASAEGGLGTGRRSSKDAQPLTRPTVSCALTCSLKGSSVFILAADEDWKCLLFFALGPVIRGSHSGHQDFEWAHSVQLSPLKKKSLGQCSSDPPGLLAGVVWGVDGPIVAVSLGFVSLLQTIPHQGTKECCSHSTAETMGDERRVCQEWGLL